MAEFCVIDWSTDVVTMLNYCNSCCFNQTGDITAAENMMNFQKWLFLV